MPFCHSPWSNIDISPQGDISPCCKFQSKYYPQTFNIQQNTIQEYINSDFVQDIKQQFQQDQWPTGCERCRIEESNNIESKRVLDYARWQEHYDHYDYDQSTLLTASIAFGNTCNLKCITCGPVSSSRWQQEHLDIHKIDIKHFKFYKKNFVQDFILSAPNIIHFDIPGGEPFLSGIDEQKELLNYYIKSGQSQNMTLHYTTNVTIFPDKEWWTLWESFKEVDMQLSIDGVGARYEYIRFPAVWSEILENVNRYTKIKLNNFKLSVSHTVSAYNIFYLDEFFTWCYNVSLPSPWLGRVHTPDYFRPSVWSATAKTKIIAQLNQSQFKDVKNWAELMANTDDSFQFEKFKKQIIAHDQYRNLDFTQTFPELAQYI